MNGQRLTREHITQHIDHYMDVILHADADAVERLRCSFPDMEDAALHHMAAIHPDVRRTVCHSRRRLTYYRRRAKESRI